MNVLDFEFFKELKGKTIKCHKDFKWRKNSLTNIFAFKGETFTINDFRDIYKDAATHIVSVKEKDIHGFIDNILDVTFSITRNKNSPISDIDYLPAIKSKRQFKIYFSIID